MTRGFALASYRTDNHLGGFHDAVHMASYSAFGGIVASDRSLSENTKPINISAGHTDPREGNDVGHQETAWCRDFQAAALRSIKRLHSSRLDRWGFVEHSLEQIRGILKDGQICRGDLAF